MSDSIPMRLSSLTCVIRKMKEPASKTSDCTVAMVFRLQGVVVTTKRGTGSGEHIMVNAVGIHLFTSIHPHVQKRTYIHTTHTFPYILIYTHACTVHKHTHTHTCAYTQTRTDKQSLQTGPFRGTSQHLAGTGSSWPVCLCFL